VLTAITFTASLAARRARARKLKEQVALSSPHAFPRGLPTRQENKLAPQPQKRSRKQLVLAAEASLRLQALGSVAARSTAGQEGERAAGARGGRGLECEAAEQG
jgi:hypothetical protein